MVLTEEEVARMERLGVTLTREGERLDDFEDDDEEGYALIKQLLFRPMARVCRSMYTLSCLHKHCPWGAFWLAE